MAWCDCKYCANYKGDCGKHFVDNSRHIDYTIPKETMFDSNGVPRCFVDTDTRYAEVYKSLQNNSDIKLLLTNDDFKTISEALLLADEKEKENR